MSKVGLLYYNVDTDRYNDIRIKRLRKEFSGNGVAVYDYILCEIYRVKGSFMEWDESTAFDVSDYFGLKETLVNEIVNYCCHVGLFNKKLLASESVLTSQSIQSRYMEICKRAKRKDAKVPEKYLILPEESSKVQEEVKKTQEEFNEVKYSKVKYSKEKENNIKEKFDFKKSLVGLGIEEKIVSDWLIVRKQKKAANTETSFNAIKNQIEISGIGANECIKIAAEKSWCGFRAEWLDNLRNNTKSTHPATNYKTKIKEDERWGR